MHLPEGGEGGLGRVAIIADPVADDGAVFLFDMGSGSFARRGRSGFSFPGDGATLYLLFSVSFAARRPITSPEGRAVAVERSSLLGPIPSSRGWVWCHRHRACTGPADTPPRARAPSPR
jgi:hypothetical protein